MNKEIIIFTGKCPYCDKQVPTPAPDMLNRRHHPCSCGKKPNATRYDDKDGNIHFSYSSNRNHQTVQPGGMKGISIRLPDYQIAWVGTSAAERIRMLIDRAIREDDCNTTFYKP